MFTIETIKTKNFALAEIESLIKAQGKYKVVGRGAYATVYGSKESDIIYKVGEVSSNQPYLSYVKVLSRLKKHNPFTPKIYGVRFYKGKKSRDNYWVDDSDYFVVAMERLNTAKGKASQVHNWFDTMLGGWAEDMSQEILGVKMIIPEQLQHAMDILKASIRKSNGCFDFHKGNFMMRGNQVVITDPLS